jgi:uncharacterized protein
VTEHSNAELARKGFDAFRRDPFALARLIAEDAVWRVPGENTMSGEYRGREAIFAFLRRTGELTGGTYRAELRWVVADDDRAVVLYRASGRRDGRALDIDQLLVCEIRGGQWADITAVPLDPHAFDAFWA